MVSSKTKYALRAILLLDENAPEGIWLHTNDVAEREQVPRKFLEAISVQLRDHEIIESRRARWVATVCGAIRRVSRSPMSSAYWMGRWR